MTPDQIISQQAAAWTAEANARLEGYALTECLLLINDWAAERRAVTALASASDVTSYSIAGRSVTRADLRSLEQSASAKADGILALLGHGGGVLRADMRGWRS